MSRREKIKMWVGIFIAAGTFLAWKLIEVPCYLFSMCGVISAILIVLALYLILGTYGSRNLKGEQYERERSN